MHVQQETFGRFQLYPFLDTGKGSLAILVERSSRIVRNHTLRGQLLKGNTSFKSNGDVKVIQHIPYKRKANHLKGLLSTLPSY